MSMATIREAQERAWERIKKAIAAAHSCRCGHIDMSLIRADKGFRVICFHCGAHGPITFTPEEAVEGWNQGKVNEKKHHD